MGAKPTEETAKPPLVVMGVAGCGKTFVGEAIAHRIGASFLEGDRFHPPENIALMSAGIALTDDNRAGWLDRIGDAIARERQTGRAVVASCSALKRSYRDRLRKRNPDVCFIFLDVDRATALSRVAARTNHFMPPSLVESQFDALEPPQADEYALTLDGRAPLESLVSAVAAYLEKSHARAG